MKIKIIAISSLLGLLLSSCAFSSSSSSSSGTPSSSEESSSNSSILTSDGNSSSDISSSESVGSNASSSSSLVPSEPITFKIASMNDLHGTIEAVGGPGLSKASSFLKKTYSSTDLLLANGDMWQGNGESNLNEGKLVTEWMNLNGFDAMSLGNHDFDWGQEAILANEKIADFPFLAANVYKYENGAVTSQASELGSVSTVLNVGSFQVGVVGGIGRDQFTSITAGQVTGLDFQDLTSIFINESERLRKEGCEVVVAEIHTAVSNSSLPGLCANSKTTGKPYYDAIFCGHSHYRKVISSNGVPIMMGYAYGKDVSEVTVNITADGVASVSNPKSLSVSSSSLDEETETLLAEYYAIQDPILDEKVGNHGNGLTATYFSEDTPELGNLNAYAMYNAIKEVDSNVVLTINNGARNDLEAGDLTFRDVYRCFPFDNAIVTMDVSESDLYGETVEYSNYIYNPTSLAAPTENGTKTYHVAVIDYLAFHQNASHRLNYFPSQTNVVTYSEDKYFPRNIVRDSFNAMGTFSLGDFSGSSYSYAA